MNLKNMLVTAGIAALLGLAGNKVMAQNNGGGGGGGGFRNMSPEERQQRMMGLIRDQMSVTNDDEWKVIEQRVQKVMDARRDAGPEMLVAHRRRSQVLGVRSQGMRLILAAGMLTQILNAAGVPKLHFTPAPNGFLTPNT